VRRFRKQGLIKPVGSGITNSGVTFYYKPKQIQKLKRHLGITLNSTRNLLSEAQFIKASGLANVRKLRKKGLIKPRGFGVSRAGVSAFYHPTQIEPLRKQLGITLSSTKGLLTEAAFIRFSRFSSLADYRKRGLIKPAGFGLSQSGVSAFYHPRQAEDLRRALGITLVSTTGLLSEGAFSKLSALGNIKKYRHQGLIKPVGYALTNSGVGAFYDRRQIPQLRKALGITLVSTAGLINETRLVQLSGLSCINRYRVKGLLKPVGFALSKGVVRPYYRPNQAQELKRSLGVTLKSIKGLLNEAQLMSITKFTSVANYRKKGLIKPVGFGIRPGGVGPFYHPRQIKEVMSLAAGVRRSGTPR
jgi:ribosomal protein S8